MATAAATTASTSATTADINLDEILAVATESAKAAGAIIAESFDRKDEFDVYSKGGVDMVTTVDKAAEKTILSAIKAKYKDHLFIAEESTASDPLTDAPTWMIDPLDGTTNFVHAYQFVCVAIGFAHKKELLVGVVFNPVLNEMYTAIKGRGAFLNGKPISVAKAKTMDTALVVNNIGAGRDVAFIDKSLACVRGAFLANVHSVRMTGSAAVNMCHVACGRVDAYWELRVGGPWDLAAGAVIVREAGGVVSLPDGSTFDVTDRGILCGNAAMVTQLSAIIRTATKADTASD